MDKEDRIAFIGFGFGMLSSITNGKISREKTVQQINDKFVEMNQSIITKEEEKILENLDNIFYYYRLASANREQFRFGIKINKK